MTRVLRNAWQGCRSAVVVFVVVIVAACSGGDGSATTTNDQPSSESTQDAVASTEAESTGSTDAPSSTAAETTTTTAASTTTESTTTTQPPPLYGRIAGGDGFEISQQPTTTDELSVQVFDDVQLDVDASVARIAWLGITCTPTQAASATDAGVTEFVLRIYGDAGGTRPDLGAVAYETVIPIAATSPELTRTSDDFPCGNVRSTWSFYEYGTTLDAPIELDAGVRYWFSIQARTPTMGSWWGWQQTNQEFGGSVRIFNGQASEPFANRAMVLRDS